MEHEHGVGSEVGRLRTVVLHRPGPELRRLTPRNNDDLLFDGVPWLDRAQDEHDQFAETLRAHDVELLLRIVPAVEPTRGADRTGSASRETV